MKGKLYRFAYHVRQKAKNRELRPYQMRDGVAFSELASLLYKKGFEYGGIYLNKKPLEGENKHIDLSIFKTNDIIVLCTRPPLHDHKDKTAKKRLERSHTNLEEEIFEFLLNFFERCIRERIILKEEVTKNFRAGFENRGDTVYKQFSNKSIFGISTSATYKRYKDIESLGWEDVSDSEKYPARTAVYFIHAKEIWEKGPSLLVSFGMGGVETLALNYLIKRRYLDLLDSNCFAMIEMSNLILPRNPLTLDFLDDWESQLILKYDF